MFFFNFGFINFETSVFVEDSSYFNNVSLKQLFHYVVH